MIYVVEDDSSIRQLLMYTLETAGLDSRGFETARVFWQALKTEAPSLVLLDLMLPDEDGLDVIRKLRLGVNTKRLPIIVITAKGSEYDKVVGLDLGADDYLPKPFGMMEMLARVRRLLKRSDDDQSKNEELFAGDADCYISVNIKTHTVSVSGKPVKLTLLEYETLLYLIHNKNVVLTRDQIMNSVWGYDYDGESRTVDVHIRSIRMKLGAPERVIETVRGVGYRIVSYI